LSSQVLTFGNDVSTVALLRLDRRRVVLDDVVRRRDLRVEALQELPELRVGVGDVVEVAGDGTRGADRDLAHREAGVGVDLRRRDVVALLMNATGS
jgi:hypothetical protein